MMPSSRASFLSSCLLLVGALASPRVLQHRQTNPQLEYDYVIVGGGTAGLTLAARLTEDNFASVAVIEAGTYYQMSNTFASAVPAGDILFIGTSPTDVNPNVDWSFVTVPQAGGNQRVIHYPRGKCLGGSSGRNFMIYQRADRGSLQMWADAVGDQSFTFENMLQFYKKSVTFSPPSASRFANATTMFDTTAFHDQGQGGPLQVSYPNYASSFSTYVLPAFSEIGIPTAPDFNSGDLLGAQYAAVTIDPYDATRSSSQTSFLRQAQNRSNLNVFDLTMAKKVIFDDNKRATGVEVDTGDTIMARREVILSAGAFQSPQLLMVSGVGPAQMLRQFNIPVVADRPGVGQNMTDHIMFGPSYKITLETLGGILQQPQRWLQELMNYFTQAQGPLTNPVVEFLGWEKAPRNMISPNASAILDALPDSWPDIEYMIAPGYVGDFSSLLMGAPLDGNNYGVILGAIVAPQSRGTVTISSADASMPPVINPNWLTHPVDQQVAVAAYKRTRAAFDSNAMRPARMPAAGGSNSSAVSSGSANSTGAGMEPETYPGPNVQTDAQILNAIMGSYQTVYHASCTCRMGKLDDPNAVVDTHGRVIGVQGLRVVDASAFALLPPGHPQSMVYALAEKIADGMKSGN